MQNLPSHDAKYTLKNMYIPPKGAILCATDFSFIELVSFAESCIQRFGFSVLGDIINAGIDPHRWFAGVRDGLISKETESLKDPETAEKLEKWLKANIPKDKRQFSKAANFGFPGGMSAKKFYIDCREKGIQLLPETAEELRNTWVGTFKEMVYQSQPEEIRDAGTLYSQYGMRGWGDDEEEEDDDGGDREKKKLYKATLVNGMVRNLCSYCSALNVQFQGLTAYGVKQAMWNVARAGFIDRIVNMIHDEIVYWLWPNELKSCIPEIERLMIAGMKTATPHVKVGVETSCMLHWDKEAVEFKDVLWDANGNPILEEPPYVKQVYRIK